MKNHTLLIRLLALVAALACALGASAYDFTYEGYYYNILTDSTAAITYKSGYNSYTGEVTIPERAYNGLKPYTVVKIDNFTFYGSTGLTSVTIPNTVTFIGGNSFRDCTALRTVVMGKNCTFYNADNNSTAINVFKNCPNLTSITCWMFEPDAWIESANLNFDQSVLYNASLYVPRGAIPNYQATRGWRLFDKIYEIYADFNYTLYYEGVFYKYKNGTFWVTYMDEDYNSYSGTVTIPKTVPYGNNYITVSGIDDYAFSKCGNLTEVNMPASIDSIGKYAFYNCTELTEIDIPNGVKYIGNGAFSWCSKLKSLMFPAGITVIYGSTCTGCSALETVWLPVNLTDIYAGAFYYCNAITTIFSLNEYPPSMYNKNVFPSTVYDNATLYIPEDAIGYGYTSPYGNWRYFTTQKPYNQYLSDAINASGSNITFSTPSADNYPWLVKTNDGRVCAQSGNTAIHSSTSALTATVTVPNGGSLSFLYKAWGDGTSTLYDVCSFYVDGEEKFRLGAYDNYEWANFSVYLHSGTHTLEWRYSKNSYNSSKGDYFAIDDVRLTTNVVDAYACYTESNTTLTFYYDTQRDSRPGTTYDLNTGTYDTGWDFDGTKDNVTKVVFDPSFANARPTTTYDWFYNMKNLQSITGMSYLNTSKVTDMRFMFYNCDKLTNLDLSHFNTSKVTRMDLMFSGCSSLTSLNVSNFNTSQVTDMYDMFNGCKSLTSLDLSSFNTSQVASMTDMFYGCRNLRTIYVGSSWSTAAVTYSSMMFYGCTSLVGGQGTAYDGDHIGKAYAHIDGGPSNPGYFTDKNAILRGDVDGDARVGIGDVTSLIDYILSGDATGLNLIAANVDGDSSVGIGDVTSLIDYILSGIW